MQEVDGQGALWKKKKSVETIVAMLTAKTKFLEKQVGCLSRENGEIGSLVTELLLLMGGYNQAEVLSAARARNESPLVYHDSAGPELNNWQLRVEAHVGAGKDLVEALTAALECLINMIMAKQQSAMDETHEIEKAALAYVESNINKIVGNLGEEVMVVDDSATTDAGSITESEDVVQGGDITCPNRG